MKNLKTTFTTVSLIALIALNLTSCKKKDETKTEEVQWTTAGVSSAMEYLKTLAEEPATATIVAGSGGTISQNGIEITLPADLFAKEDGAVFSGNVKLKLFTVNSTKEAIFKRISTISDSGDLLISGGMFKLEAADEQGNPLKVASGKTYLANMASSNPNDKIFKGVVRAKTADQVSWDVWPNTGIKRGTTNNSILNGLDDFAWCNLDRYMSEKPLTDIFVTLPQGFTNANTEVFMKYTGENTSAYIPANPTLKQFTTSGSYYKVVQGRAAKLIAMCKKDGKYYYAVLTISSINANHSVTISAMTETTESDFKNQINNF